MNLYGELTGYCFCGKDLGKYNTSEIEQHYLNHKRRWDYRKSAHLTKEADGQ